MAFKMRGTPFQQQKLSMKDFPIGSVERYKEYERRGWKQDHTTPRPTSSRIVNYNPKLIKKNA